MADKKKILVVDDEPSNVRLLEVQLLSLGYEILTAFSGEECLKKVIDSPVDLILLDVLMPGLDGFEVSRQLKTNEETRFIPIILVTALTDAESKIEGINAGCDDFISKPVDKHILLVRVRSLLKVKSYYDHLKTYEQDLERDIAKKTKELQRAFEKIKLTSLDTIFILSSAAEYRDEDTGEHIQRISHCAEAIARKMDLDDDDVESILYASPMHDIGKIGIPDSVLLKPGKLDPNEWEQMKRHTIIGKYILEGSDSKYIKLAETIALDHHEKWDGSGYPNRLKGDEIPIVGRITAIVDVFDAVMSRRPYKEAFSLEKSLAIIEEGRGSSFDPKVVDAFFVVKEKILEIRDVYKQ